MVESRFWMVFGAVLTFTFAIGACGGHDLRGRAVHSPDGGTYLAVDEAESDRCSLYVDGKAWTYSLKTPGAIQPGVHWIGCNSADTTEAIGFRIAPGTTFHFDYWGP